MSFKAGEGTVLISGKMARPVSEGRWALDIVEPEAKPDAKQADTNASRPLEKKENG